MLINGHKCKEVVENERLLVCLSCVNYCQNLSGVLFACHLPKGRATCV